VAATTLQGFDRLDGGGGTDTLQAELYGSTSIGSPILTSIETLELTNSALAAATLDLAGADSVETIQARGSRGDITVTAGQAASSCEVVSQDTDLSVEGLTATDVDVLFASADATLTLDGVAAGGALDVEVADSDAVIAGLQAGKIAI